MHGQPHFKDIFKLKRRATKEYRMHNDIANFQYYDMAYRFFNVCEILSQKFIPKQFV